MPFIGHDRWHAYELSWLNTKGKPQVAMATITVPAYSPFLIESKSLKLYLNSFNHMRLDSADELLERIDNDLTAVAGADVEVKFGVPNFEGTPTPHSSIISLDDLDVTIETYGPPDKTLLSVMPRDIKNQTLVSQLLKSNCPVTSQPDWASIRIRYSGPQLDPESVLRYIVSFRDHCEFHEQCVERIFCDILSLGMESLSVDARYTRRGGLDINPWRATPDWAELVPWRDERQ